MTILDPMQLRTRIGRDDFDYLTLKNALSDYSRPDQKISELLKSGVITSVKKGLYVFDKTYRQGWIFPETLANQIYGPSCISLEYALAWHGMIPERVYTITSVTPKKNKVFETAVGRFTYQHLSLERYPQGIRQVWLSDSHAMLIASPEKALCDYVLQHKINHVHNAQEAKDFLEDDLRIDEWRIQLNRNELRRLNKYYRRPVIEHILELL
jgi:predicted transcriptional regulator of viral defense system